LELSVENRREFHANVRLRRVGERMAGTISPDSCGVVRTERRARQAEAGYLKVLWHLNGKIRVEQDRRCSSLVNGDVTVCDTARPYQVWVAEDAKFAVLTLPYAAVPSWERLSQKLCGSVLRDRVTTRAALAAMISLLSDSASYQPDGAEAVMQAVQWMISASLHCSGPSGGVYGEAVSSALKFDAAPQHVLAHIDDPKLGPDELADALHISRRKLYLIFKAHELTPARFIHNVRLDAVKRALATLDNADRSIFRIAIDHGFTQSASFSRAFKTSFGLSQHEARRIRGDRARHAPCIELDCPSYAESCSHGTRRQLFAARSDCGCESERTAWTQRGAAARGLHAVLITPSVLDSGPQRLPPVGVAAVK
jgi:AraC family transcriptional regulator, positive regulator of tynA and feaB